MNEIDRHSEPTHTADALFPFRLRRFIPLVAVAGMSVSLVGFLTGIREPIRSVRPTPRTTAVMSNIPSAVFYAELPLTRLGSETNRFQSLASLKSDRPNVFDPVQRTEVMKLAAIADRALNRAYDGAPPTIPHPVESQSLVSCLTCHLEGLKVGDRIATKISHAPFTNCTQCHVAQVKTIVENSFIGVYRAGPGQRASPGAPPTIPHHTWMRENCMSCHGLVSRPGTRTTHPWLTNCTQCHVPSANLDHLDFSGVKE